MECDEHLPAMPEYRLGPDSKWYPSCTQACAAPPGMLWLSHTVTCIWPPNKTLDSSACLRYEEGSCKSSSRTHAIYRCDRKHFASGAFLGLADLHAICCQHGGTAQAPKAAANDDHFRGVRSRCARGGGPSKDRHCCILHGV